MAPLICRHCHLIGTECKPPLGPGKLDQILQGSEGLARINGLVGQFNTCSEILRPPGYRQNGCCIENGDIPFCSSTTPENLQDDFGVFFSCPALDLSEL